MFTIVVSRSVVNAPRTNTKLMRFSRRFVTGAAGAAVTVVVMLTKLNRIVQINQYGTVQFSFDRVFDMKAVEDSAKPMRKGAELKREAILAAARELFVRLGVDGVSMDAIAARARVSKATVYDYFGDKRRLFLAILGAASESLDASARKVLDEHLSGTTDITNVAQLEAALTAVAVDLGRTIVASAEYATAFALVAQQRMKTGSDDDDVTTEALEEVLAERMAHFAAIGLLDTHNPRLAADHFAALTVLLAYNHQPVPAKADPDRIRQIMVDGARAFMRAYGSRSHA